VAACIAIGRVGMAESKRIFLSPTGEKNIVTIKYYEFLMKY
jgi:hypothetical protein